MPHIYLPYERGMALHFVCRQIIGMILLELWQYVGEYFRYGICAESTLAEHIFMSRFGMHLHNPDPGSLLPAVVLLFHKQVELVQRIGVRAVFTPVIFNRLAEAYHRHTAFMFELFHS